MELEEALAEPRERWYAAGAARSRRLLISRVFELFASPDAGTHPRRYALLLYLFAVCGLLHALLHVMHHNARGFQCPPAPLACLLRLHALLVYCMRLRMRKRMGAPPLLSPACLRLLI